MLDSTCIYSAKVNLNRKVLGFVQFGSPGSDSSSLRTRRPSLVTVRTRSNETYEEGNRTGQKQPHGVFSPHAVETTPIPSGKSFPPMLYFRLLERLNASSWLSNTQ